MTGWRGADGVMETLRWFCCLCLLGFWFGPGSGGCAIFSGWERRNYWTAYWRGVDRARQKRRLLLVFTAALMILVALARAAVGHGGDSDRAEGA